MHIKQTSGACVGKCVFALFLIFTGFPAVSADTSQISVIDRQLEKMPVLDHQLITNNPDKESVRNRGLVNFYRAQFDKYQVPSVLTSMSDQDLHALMLAAELAVFYSYDDDILDDVMLDLGLLQSRAVASAADFGGAYRLLVANRRFDEARRFLKSHSVLHESAPPRLLDLRSDRHGAAEMRVGDIANTLVWAPVDIEQLPRILVIGHPLCHFTQNAVRAIEADPKLRALFAQHSKWLAPQDQTTDFELFRQWNRQHPEEPLSIAYSAAAFVPIDNWATPTFYFIDHGRIVGRMSGWPREGRRDEILAMYQQAFPSIQPRIVR